MLTGKVGSSIPPKQGIHVDDEPSSPSGQAAAPTPETHTPSDEQFWQFMEENAEIVKRWPGWKRIAAGLSADSPTGGAEPLLHKPNDPLPKGCYCKPGQCMAPVIMGRQMPCRDPKKAQGKQRCCDNGYFGESHDCQKSNPVSAGAELSAEQWLEMQGLKYERAAIAVLLEAYAAHVTKEMREQLAVIETAWTADLRQHGEEHKELRDEAAGLREQLEQAHQALREIGEAAVCDGQDKLVGLVDAALKNDQSQLDYWSTAKQWKRRAEAAESQLSTAREALQKAYRFIRGKHSTLTYGPKVLCDELEATLAALAQSQGH